ncbi:TRAP transporter substrate-binding protein [Pseudocolwellia agarivorans]|uniref:TRAP transporter substrate-binding protein n=1 Tax=Pseudocolwellia agarivorans TaxID=1911682 RepID=UPI003F88466E
MKNLPSIYAGIIFCLALAGCSKNDDVTVLRIAHTVDVEHSTHKAIQHMAERLAFYSGNTMEIKIYPYSQLGGEREVLEQLQMGSLAMTQVSAATIEGFVPEMKLYAVPYLFRNREHKWKVLESDIGQELLDLTEKAHFVGLGYYDSGSRSFYMTEDRVESPADLVGRKIRVMQSQSSVKMVQSLGGAAAPISMGELYAALQQGVVDGAENNPPMFYLSHHYEISKYYVLDEHTSIPEVIIASKYIMSKLSEQQRTWLNMAVKDSVKVQRELWLALEQKSLTEVEKAGVEIIYPDKQPFIDALAPLYKSLEGTITSDYLERVNDMVVQGDSNE